MSRFRLLRALPWLRPLFRPWVVSNVYESAAFLLKHRRIPRFSKTRNYNDLLFRLRALETDYVFRAFSADKAFAKILIRGIDGRDLCVPTLAVLHSPDDLDRFDFPDECVIKPTHMSAEVVFHGAGPVSAADRAKMRGWFTENFGLLTGERHYQRLVPKIIVEPWLRLNGAFCHDFRFYFHQAALKVIEVKVRKSQTEATHVMMTPDWVRLQGKMRYAGTTSHLDGGGIAVPKPDCLDQMIAVGRNVAKYLDFVRVDFFSDGGEVFYVGEVSHISANARQVFDPVTVERVFVD